MSEAKKAVGALVIGALVCFTVGGPVYLMWSNGKARAQAAHEASIERRYAQEATWGEYAWASEHIKTHPEAVPSIKKALADGVLTRGEVVALDEEIIEIDVFRKKIKWIAYSEDLGNPNARAPLPVKYEPKGPIWWKLKVVYHYTNGEKDGEEFVLHFPISQPLEYDKAYDALKVLTPEVPGYYFNGVSPGENNSVIADLRPLDQIENKLRPGKTVSVRHIEDIFDGLDSP